MYRLGTGDPHVCVEARSTNEECATASDPHTDGQRFPEAYIEGVGIDGAYLSSLGTSGLEGLRLLAREFSSRSRAEASFFRTEFLGKTYKASPGVTQVTDVIRQIDVGLSRFRKMIATLPATVSKLGFEVQTRDLAIMWLRS